MNPHIFKHGHKEPWHTPVYVAQCQTAKIAAIMTGLHVDAMPGSWMEKPPYCLRIVRQYRTQNQQLFRDAVARETRDLRRAA